MQWGYIGSPDMLEYEVTEPSMSLQGVALLWGFLDPNQPWESLDETYKKDLIAGWLTSTGQNGKALVTPKDRLKN